MTQENTKRSRDRAFMSDNDDHKAVPGHKRTATEAAYSMSFEMFQRISRDKQTKKAEHEARIKAKLGSLTEVQLRTIHEVLRAMWDASYPGEEMKYEYTERFLEEALLVLKSGTKSELFFLKPPGLGFTTVTHKMICGTVPPLGNIPVTQVVEVRSGGAGSIIWQYQDEEGIPLVHDYIRAMNWKANPTQLRKLALMAARDEIFGTLRENNRLFALRKVSDVMENKPPVIGKFFRLSDLYLCMPGLFPEDDDVSTCLKADLGIVSNEDLTENHA